MQIAPRSRNVAPWPMTGLQGASGSNRGLHEAAQRSELGVLPSLATSLRGLGASGGSRLWV